MSDQFCLLECARGGCLELYRPFDENIARVSITRKPAHACGNDLARLRPEFDSSGFWERFSESQNIDLMR